MGQFAIFFPRYGSCFVNLALVMGLLYGDLPCLWANSSKFIAINKYHDKKLM